MVDQFLIEGDVTQSNLNVLFHNKFWLYLITPFSRKYTWVLLWKHTKYICLYILCIQLELLGPKPQNILYDFVIFLLGRTFRTTIEEPEHA